MDTNKTIKEFKGFFKIINIKLIFVISFLLCPLISFSLVFENDSVFYIKPNTVFVNTDKTLCITFKEAFTDLSNSVYVKRGTILYNGSKIEKSSIVYESEITTKQAVVSTKTKSYNFDKAVQSPKTAKVKDAVNTQEFKIPFPIPFKQTSYFQPCVISISLTHNDKNKPCLNSSTLLAYSQFTKSVIDFIYKPLPFYDIDFVKPKTFLFKTLFARPPTNA